MPTLRKAVVITSPVPKLLISPRSFSVGAVPSLYMPKPLLRLQQIQVGYYSHERVGHQAFFGVHPYMCTCSHDSLYRNRLAGSIKRKLRSANRPELRAVVMVTITAPANS